MRFSVLLVCACALVSCTSYHVGSVKPAALAGVQTIAVPMMANDTQHPRAEAVATSAVAAAFSRDGTYRIGSVGQADAVLEARVGSIRYETVRSRRLDVLRPEELVGTVVITWTLKDSRQPGKILATGTSTGSSQFFVDADLQTARHNALPDATERAAVALVSRLANGF